MTDQQETTGTFESTDGLKMFYREYRAEEERARLVIAHGIGEHSGRYRNVVHTLLPDGISVWAVDLRGHGKSGGRRGHVSAFDQYLHDLLLILKIVREGMPEGRKCFLLGHSMGGLIALDFVIHYPDAVDGVVISSPSLGITVKVPPAKKMLGKVMSSVLPGLTLANGLDVTKLSHDEQVVRAYVDDPLVHDRVSTRWFTEIVRTMEEVNESASKVTVPIMIQVAGDDHLTDAARSQEFFARLSVEDKSLHVYDGFYHEIYNEKEELRTKPLADLDAWVKDHSPI
jgi:alpha-beta hydrolase superfamily lysophospholipase